MTPANPSGCDEYNRPHSRRSTASCWTPRSDWRLLAVLTQHVLVQVMLRRVQLSTQPTPEHLLLGTDGVRLRAPGGLLAAAAAAAVLVDHVVVQVTLRGVQPAARAALKRLPTGVHPGGVVGQALPAAQRHATLEAAELPAGCPLVSGALGPAPLRVSGVLGRAPLRVSGALGRAPLRVSRVLGRAPLRVSGVLGPAPLRVGLWELIAGMKDVRLVCPLGCRSGQDIVLGFLLSVRW